MNKRLLLPLSLLCLVGCQKEGELSPNSGESSGGIVITATTDQSVAAAVSSSSTESRVGYEDNTDGTTSGKISLTWQNSGTKVDSFSIYDSEGEYVGEFEYSGVDGATTGAFTQVGIFSMNVDETYTAVIPAVEPTEGVYPTLEERDAMITTQEQVIYSLDDLSYLDDVMRLRGEFTYDLLNTTITFSHEVSILQCTITMPEEVYPKIIYMEDGELQYEVHVPYSHASNSVSFYIAVEPNDAEYNRTINFAVTDQDGAEYTDSKTTTEPFEAGVIRRATLSLDESNQIYVDYYTTGVTINGVTYDSTNSTLVTSTSTLSNTAGVQFLDPESEDTVFTLNGATYNNIVLIGRYSHKKPKVVCGGVQYLGTGGDVIYKNIDFTGFSTNYTFNFASSSASLLNSWIFEDCNITTIDKQPLTYFSKSAENSIKEIIWNNNRVNIVSSTDSYESTSPEFHLIWFVQVDVDLIEKIDISRNVFYSSSDYYINLPLIVFQQSEESDMEMTFKNNTLINIISTSGIIYLPDAKSIDVDKNIFWGEDRIELNFNLIRVTLEGSTPEISLGDNIAYGGKYWRYYSSSTKYPEGAPSTVFTKEGTDPFATFRKSNGTFLPKIEYSSYGALAE